MGDFVPREYLGQIILDGELGLWVDYARGTEEEARAWIKNYSAGQARVVDWIDKNKVLFEA